ncbi:MAG TPA: hypothetical protein VKK81_14930 [Candidatus Binatia bacterium]|nr:hypothetical protein [Candidatus Binatia bacterium]
MATPTRNSTHGRTTAGLLDLQQRLEQVDTDIVSAAALHELRRAQKVQVTQSPPPLPEYRTSVLHDVVGGIAHAAAVMADDAADRGRRLQWRLVVRAARKLERLLAQEP